MIVAVPSVSTAFAEGLVIAPLGPVASSVKERPDSTFRITVLPPTTRVMTWSGTDKRRWSKRVAIAGVIGRSTRPDHNDIAARR